MASCGVRPERSLRLSAMWIDTNSGRIYCEGGQFSGWCRYQPLAIARPCRRPPIRTGSSPRDRRNGPPSGGTGAPRCSGFRRRDCRCRHSRGPRTSWPAPASTHSCDAVRQGCHRHRQAAAGRHPRSPVALSWVLGHPLASVRGTLASAETRGIGRQATPRWRRHAAQVDRRFPDRCRGKHMRGRAAEQPRPADATELSLGAPVVAAATSRPRRRRYKKRPAATHRGGLREAESEVRSGRCERMLDTPTIVILVPSLSEITALPPTVSG